MRAALGGNKNTTTQIHQHENMFRSFTRAPESPADEPLLGDEGAVQVARRALGHDGGLEVAELGALAARQDAGLYQGLLGLEVRCGVGRGVQRRRHKGVPELDEERLVGQEVGVVERQARLPKGGGGGGRGS